MRSQITRPTSRTRVVDAFLSGSVLAAPSAVPWSPAMG